MTDVEFRDAVNQHMARQTALMEQVQAALPKYMTKEACDAYHDGKEQATEQSWKARAFWATAIGLVLTVVALVLTYTVGPL